MSKDSEIHRDPDGPEDFGQHASIGDTPPDDDPHPDFAEDRDPDYDPTEHMTKEELDELARDAELAEREYEGALVQEALRNISKDAAKNYLSRYGDAVDARIHACLEQAKQLVSGDHFGPALALAATALEVTIRFLLLRPLVQGAFLSDRWAAILAARIATGRTAEDREMLPAILREWGVDVTRVKSPDGMQVWPFIVGRLWGFRDKFVHRFDPVTREIALQAIDSAHVFRAEVVGTVAKRLGFTLDVTKRWSAISRPNGKLDEVETGDPFAERVKPKRKEPGA